MHPTWMIFIVCMVCSLCANDGFATEDLPIGKRKYVIDTENEFKPVEITKRDQPVEKTFLKDPNLNDLGKLAEPLKKPKQKRKVVKQAKSHKKAMVFRPLAVVGQQSQPRVQFTNEKLSVGRADEPLSADFFDKVFAPAKDSEF